MKVLLISVLVIVVLTALNLDIDYRSKYLKFKLLTSNKIDKN